MAGSGEVTPVEGEGGVGENSLVGQAEASSRDPGSVHPVKQNKISFTVQFSLLYFCANSVALVENQSTGRK
jgi:hypothetical protein